MRNSLIVLVGCALLGASSPASSTPLIHEVFYDATGSDAPGVFTELFGTPGLDLNGWSLVGINGSTGDAYRTLDLSGAVLPADGILVIATSRASLELAADRDFTANVDWQNGPDAVQLIDPTGLIIDALQYGIGPTFSGEGLPAEDASSGLSLSRDLQSSDSNDNSVDFIAGMPSPGLGPMVSSPPPSPAPMPTPSPLALMGTALVVLGRRARPRVESSTGAQSSGSVVAVPDNRSRNRLQ